MKVANIADLKNRLSAYLQFVRDGEEVVVKDRNRPVARITAYDDSEFSDRERRLVAAGMLKMPQDKTENWEQFWDEFFALPASNLTQEAAIRSVVEEREEGW